jgi:hypothetical protein
MLGASAFAISVVSGGGELVGYGLRLWSGRLADRTHHYWGITFAGYALNLFAVPLLALAGSWQVAAALVILERTGKALRTPARDAMLSYASKTTGRGWGFRLHEALEVGATVGPLVLTVVIAQNADYRRGFAALLVPALAALGTLALAWRLYPRPEDLEIPDVRLSTSAGFPKAYWVYLCGSALVAAGYADYPLLAYHFGRAGTVSLALDSGVVRVGHGCRCDRRGDLRTMVRSPRRRRHVGDRRAHDRLLGAHADTPEDGSEDREFGPSTEPE